MRVSRQDSYARPSKREGAAIEVRGVRDFELLTATFPSRSKIEKGMTGLPVGETETGTFSSVAFAKAFHETERSVVHGAT